MCFHPKDFPRHHEEEMDLFRTRKSLVFAVFAWITFLSAGTAEPSASVTPPPDGGLGSYTTVIPAPGVRPDGGKVSLTPPACGPSVSLPATDLRKVPTNDWWTPLAWIDTGDLPDPAPLLPMKALSWQVFSDPLVFQPQKGGLAVSLNIPDSRRAAMKNGTLTAGAGFLLEVVGDAEHGGKGISPYFNGFFDQDLYLGSTASGWNKAAYESVRVTGWSDWFMNFTLGSAAENLRITAGNGSPFILVKTDSGMPQVTFRTWNVGTVIPLKGKSFSLNAGQAKDQSLDCEAFAVINKVPYGAPASPSGASGYSTYTVYGIFGPSGSTWKLNDTQFNSEQRGPFPKWGAARSYATGSPVEPSVRNGFFYTANAAGTSGNTEPAWPETAGGTVKDGTVTWTANALESRTVLNTASCSAGKYYAVAVLPYPWGKSIYDSPDEVQVRTLLASFAEYAFAEVTDTRADPLYNPLAAGKDVTVSFTFSTAPVGTETPAGDAPLRAMYPHQYLEQRKVFILDRDLKQVSASAWDQGWYWPSLKGPMLLASGNSFQNSLDVPPCLPAPVDDPEKAKADRMAACLDQAMETRDPNFLSQGSYFGAQEMHRLAMLLPMAEMIRGNASDPAKVDTSAKGIYQYVSDALGYRLRASRENGTAKNAAEHVFYYDSRWGSMIPSPEDGFAADSLLNDHHFHYGYFLKTAAEIARWEKGHPTEPGNKKWAEAYAPMIRLLIRDIAHTNRSGTGKDPDFPFLRYFSPYAGHSWANGPSRGNQGGQQESSSEAIQAWAGILLWSQLNFPEDGENADLERWAAWLFASEARCAELYWFGFTADEAFKPWLSFRQFAGKSDNVPLPYVPSLVSQVNQNEMTFQTDFGNPPLLKLGIQMLPLTGSSLYLASGSGNADALVAGYLNNDLPKLGDGGTSPSNKDKLIMLQAMTDRYKENAKALITPAPDGSVPLDSWKMQWQIPAPTFDNLILQDTSRGAIFWWIDCLLSHGLPLHGENGADHSSAACFRDERGRTLYTAYNPDTSPLVVTFADGKSMEVAPLAYAHETAEDISSAGCAAGPLRPGAALLFLAGMTLFLR